MGIRFLYTKKAPQDVLTQGDENERMQRTDEEERIPDEKKRTHENADENAHEKEEVMTLPPQEQEVTNNLVPGGMVIFFEGDAIPDECYERIIPILKKRKKRKKGFDREIIRVKDRNAPYRQINPIHQQFPNTYQRANRKDRI